MLGVGILAQGPLEKRYVFCPSRNSLLSWDCQGRGRDLKELSHFCWKVVSKRWFPKEGSLERPLWISDA